MGPLMPRRFATILIFLGLTPLAAQDDHFEKRVRPLLKEQCQRCHGDNKLRGGFDERAPLAQLLEQFRTIRAELRFKEDGVNTVVTIERGKK